MQDEVVSEQDWLAERAKVYDSVRPGLIPATAHYAALYADGEFRVEAGTNITRFEHRRWITVTGLLHHVGIADFEYPNLVFMEPARLQAWASYRIAHYDVPGIVYSDMADIGRALRALGDTPVIHWIATRNRGQLTPTQLSELIKREYNITLNDGDIWAHQYENVNDEYDVSNLFGKFYH